MSEPRYIERLEDMSPLGRLRLIVQVDGDVIIAIQPDPDAPSWNRESVEFCTRAGGGRSPRTLRALHQLAEAMEQDNAENPIPRPLGTRPQEVRE